MIIAIASFKGGVGKTTTAMHLAGFLQSHGPTLLIDTDPNQSAIAWAKRGPLPFDVIDEWHEAPATDYHHIVIDTQARPTPDDFAILADSSEFLILPTTPDILAMDALALTLEQLHDVGAYRYRILLTIIPPKPSKDGEQARTLLQEANLPVFARGIPRSAAYRKAASDGSLTGLVNNAAARKAWAAYEAVGQELLTLGVSSSSV